MITVNCGKERLVYTQKSAQWNNLYVVNKIVDL